MLTQTRVYSLNVRLQRLQSERVNTYREWMSWLNWTQNKHRTKQNDVAQWLVCCDVSGGAVQRERGGKQGWSASCTRLIFTARCYAERGYATVCRLCLSVRLWRSGIVITYRVGKKSKPDNFSNNFVYCHTIFIIFGRYTLEEICNRGIYS